MRRPEFTARTKVEAFTRSGGRCEKCTARLSVGNTEYDHEIACGLGGDNDVRNCIVLCRSCHRAKTYQRDVPAIAKAKRNHRHTIGVRKPRSIFGWKSMSGEPRRATRER